MGISSEKNPVNPYIASGYKKRGFRSLRWKISLSSSLILLAVVALFCFISYLGLMANFDNQRDTDYRRYSREIDNLINNTSQNLYQLAEIIPFLDSMKKVLLTNDGESIDRAFDQHWALLQLHNNVEFVYFYNQFNQFNAGWDNLESRLNENGLLLEWVSQVNQSEQPINPLLCRESCIQFIVAPLLVEGRKVGAVVLGISLADVLLAFKRIFSADIGLLVEKQSHSPHQDDLDISPWDVQISALTNKDRNHQILNMASQLYPDMDVLHKGIQVHWNDLHQQIKLFSLDPVKSDNAHLVIITDVTAAVNNIHDSIWKIALTGFLGLIISEILLLLIFARLLSRLKDVAFALPLLASGQFENFRLSLAATDRVQRFNDEVDTLSEAAVALSLQLEKLELKVSTRTKMLIEQRDELSKERDFVKNLLDTAQAIVLTQNSEGKIISLNAYGEMLTRYTEKELQGKSFLTVLIPEYESQDSLALFKEIHTGQKMQLRHEAITHCKDGSTRHVAWLHSHLSWNSEEDPSILSVGLDVTEYKRVEGHLAWLADHDPLTNMFNRRRFSEELEQVLSRAERYRHPGALLFFDLDRFKFINDTSGHHAGDTLLKIVANMLAQTIRADDITGRLGGDEFAIILPEINVDGAIEVAKKVLNQLDQAQLTIDNRTHKISASIGIALFPEHGANIHDLLAAADLAMYQAKAMGRNAWYLFSDNDRSRERVQTLVYWKEKIEYSHLHDNFMLYLQPIMSIKSKQISHYEVLLRMQDTDGTIRSPGDFIPAAEHTGLIHAIDHMVLRKAIAQAAKIYQAGYSVNFSINLSAHAFNDPELLPILKQQLMLYHIEPENLMFEITETAALEDLPGARGLMREIKELGCGFVLDDFGVGFSSFYYLRELPVDVVKIDGSFIRNLSGNSDDLILVNALCSVARGFGKKITAEFVESAETLSLIENMDIDYAQGYYIGKPWPANEFLMKHISVC
ncbi:EAL domain-containing protein [Nitrosomonas sp. Nm166]|uniref:bifunctional diguanylate cyclase/phosphodiesterase n=1 Tax=Nitrosomonas sp. Nm166 TaxID=1881054 RepID=UPI0008ED140B|nr:EAL domain-containing protein [Nitrosomonas sp. Nm166]SFE60842.1 PAS domain S-box-containing protein/diguanylate cyclase (GGDEF) domain-containing protein [Nitrosomonas sp. Nm166]